LCFRGADAFGFRLWCGGAVERWLAALLVGQGRGWMDGIKRTTFWRWFFSQSFAPGTATAAVADEN